MGKGLKNQQKTVWNRDIKIIYKKFRFFFKKICRYQKTLYLCALNTPIL